MPRLRYHVPLRLKRRWWTQHRAWNSYLSADHTPPVPWQLEEKSHISPQDTFPPIWTRCSDHEVCLLTWIKIAHILEYGHIPMGECPAVKALGCDVTWSWLWIRSLLLISWVSLCNVMVWTVPPKKDVVILYTSSYQCDLFRNRVFADGQVKMGSLEWLSSNSFWKKKCGHKDTGSMICEDEGRWCNHQLGNANDFQKISRSWERSPSRFSPTTLRKNHPCRHLGSLTSSLQDWEIVHSCCFKLSCWRHFAMAA